MQNYTQETSADKVTIKRPNDVKVKRTCKMSLEMAVELAITECIRDDILAEFLRKNRAEAKSMSIYEYDEEKHMRQVKEEGRQDGIAEGITLGITRGIAQGEKKKLLEQINRKLEKGKSIIQIAAELEENEETIRKLIEEV